MSVTPRSEAAAPSLDARLEDVCVRFEDAWRAGRRPPLEHHLGEFPAAGRSALFEQLLKLDLHYRRQAGEQPTPDEYCARFPEDAETLRRAFAGSDGGTADTGPGAGAPSPPSPSSRYVRLRLHARGGLGEVHEARDVELGRTVALKRIRDRFATGESRRRFLAEAEITGRLEHPGVVPVYGLVRGDDGGPCYAMRFIAGQTLQEAIRSLHAAGTPADGRLDLRQLLARFVTVCNTVAYAHSRGIVHRDLKPANVMLGKYGETLVVDWGLAKPFDRGDGARADGEETLAPAGRTSSSSGSTADESAGTRTGAAVGTPAYMSPEQAAGDLDRVGPASDLFGLGAILYALLTDRAPYDGLGRDEAVVRARRAAFPPPRAVRRGVPRPLEAICLKAMAAEPGARYPSALALAADVERWLADEPVAAYREPPTVRLRRWVRKRPRLAAAAVAALAVGLAAAGVVAWQRDRAERAVAMTREQKRRTREALDKMISKEIIERLAEQRQISAEQRSFLKMALTYYREFAAEAATDDEGRRLEADAHSRVGKMLAVLGPRTEAESALRSAVTAQDRVAAASGRPDDARDLAAAHGDLAWMLLGLNRAPDAEAEYRAAVAVAEKLVADSPKDPACVRTLARSHNGLGGLLRQQKKLPEAEREFRAALTLYESIPADRRATPEHRNELGVIRYNVGLALAGQGRLAAADEALRAALPVQEPLAKECPDVHRYRFHLNRTKKILAQVAEGLGNRDAAGPALRAALAESEKLSAEFPGMADYTTELANCLTVLGNFVRDGGDPRAALEFHARAIGRLAGVGSSDAAWLGARHELRFAHGNRAMDLMALGRFDDALPDWDRAAQFDDGEYRELVGLHRAECLARLGRGGEAAAAAEELLAGPKGGDAELLFLCGRIFALAAAGPPSDAVAARSVATLRRAAAAGYPDVPRVAADRDFAPLRGRGDFTDLLWDLADVPTIRPAPGARPK